jgi:hypothetical protein
VGCDGIPDGSSTFKGSVSSEGADDPAGPPDPPDAFVTTTGDAFCIRGKEKKGKKIVSDRNWHKTSVATSTLGTYLLGLSCTST